MSDLHLFQEIVLLIPCLIFSKNFILALIDKATTGTKILGLFIRNFASVVCIADTSGTGGLAFGLPGTADVIDISDIICSFDHDKSNILQLINCKSKDL